MITNYDEMYEPIKLKQMNEKLVEASKLARQQPQLIIAGQLINFLRVAAIGYSFLVLHLTKSYLYEAMLARQEQILQAIQLIVPEVTDIMLIEVSDDD